MTKAIDVAKYILCIANTNGDLITNLKLQKLLYYAQAWYMVNFDGQKLFDDDIEAWQFGPVIKSIYNLFKDFGREPILLSDEECNDYNLSETQKSYLAEFCETFLRYSATELVGMTHNEKKKKKAYEQANNTVIDTDLMFELNIIKILCLQQEKDIINITLCFLSVITSKLISIIL